MEELKKNEGPTLLRQSSLVFQIICAILCAAGIVYGIVEMVDKNLSGIIYICIGIITLIIGYLIRGASLCLADIAEK
ncbi:hypothetical protein [Bacteroides nordii]|uniref:hypothetical protein n=1 Tax=Bacteroides nordii TaxID=291645 RepID=UPI002A7FD782|nr:hypothetical protein [Bacteroides nordii]